MASIPFCTLDDVGEGNFVADVPAAVATITDRSAAAVVSPKFKVFVGDEVGVNDFS